MGDFLTKIGGALRWLIFWIDSLGFGFIDQAYNLMLAAMSGFNSTEVGKIAANLTKNAYIIIGIFALFRLAISLVNAIVNPEKLTDKKEGVGNILFHFAGAIVLFVVVPLIFSMSREVQAIIVGGPSELNPGHTYQGNIIPKLITGYDLNDTGNAGEVMQLTAIKSLIVPDSDIAELGETWVETNIEADIKKCESNADSNSFKKEKWKMFKKISGKYIPKDECNGSTDCVSAVNAWNENRMRTTNISKYIASYVKVGDENVFVYHYMPFITLAVGLFMTYILFSFTIDVALGSVELLILEILSPLFIVTFVDPKMASSGPFSKWLKACSKSYLSLFIRIAVISLMLLLIANMEHFFGSMNGLLQLLMIIAILIFAKKAPKWLGEMFGLDDGAGLGGLGIGKKLAGAALVGGALSKAGRGLAGAMTGGAKALHNNAKDRRARKKQIRKDNELTHGLKGRKQRQAYDGSYFQQRKQLHNARKEKYAEGNVGAKNNAAKIGASLARGTMLGAQAGIKADNLRGSFTAGTKAADDFAGRMAMKNHNGIFDRIGNKVKKLPGAMEKAYGSSNELYDERDAQSKIEKARKWTEKGDNGAQGVGIGKGKVITGQKDANTVCDALVNSGLKVDSDNFAAAQYALNRGIMKIDENSDGKTIMLGQGQPCIDNNGNPIKDKNGNELKSGIVKEVDSKGNEFYKITSSTGIVHEVSKDDLRKNVGGVMDSSSNGMVSQAQMVNTYQKTVLDNYSQNEQLKSQEMATYQNAKTQENNCFNTAQNVAQNLAAGLSGALSSFGSSLAINSSSFDTLRDSMSEGMGKISKEIEKLEGKNDESSKTKLAKLKEIKEEMKKGSDAIEAKEKEATTFKEVAEQNYKNIEIIENAQGPLRQVVKSMDGTTVAEKAHMLDLDAKKWSDKQEGLSPKDEK